MLLQELSRDCRGTARTKDDLEIRSPIADLENLLLAWARRRASDTRNTKAPRANPKGPPLANTGKLRLEFPNVAAGRAAVLLASSTLRRHTTLRAPPVPEPMRSQSRGPSPLPLCKRTDP